MSFDNSRSTFNPCNDYAGVVMQQGRVQLDADWNEWLSEFARRMQAGTLDILGRAVYPATTPYAFQITASSSGGSNLLTIGPGRMYVDGLLAENHGDPTTAVWDPGACRDLEYAAAAAPNRERRHQLYGAALHASGDLAAWRQWTVSRLPRRMGEAGRFSERSQPHR